jgi:hypothetical protein
VPPALRHGAVVAARGVSACTRGQMMINRRRAKKPGMTARDGRREERAHTHTETRAQMARIAAPAARKGRETRNGRPKGCGGAGLSARESGGRTGRCVWLASPRLSFRPRPLAVVGPAVCRGAPLNTRPLETKKEKQRDGGIMPRGGKMRGVWTRGKKKRGGGGKRGGARGLDETKAQSDGRARRRHRLPQRRRRHCCCCCCCWCCHPE